MIAIHIGLKKSGSASIQSFLVANEDALAHEGLDYPKTGRGPFKDHHNLASELHGRRKFDAKYGTLAELAERWRANESVVHLLSSEMFEECEPEEIAQIKAIFDQSSRTYRVVLVIRDLGYIMPSSYAQKVKFGSHVYDFDTFFEERISERRTNYFLTAQRWAEVFGWDNVRVRLLDTNHLVNGDLIDDFMAALDFDPNRPQIRALRRPGPVNVAPGWRVLEAVRGFVSDRHGLSSNHPLAGIVKSDLGGNSIEMSVHRKKFGNATMQVGEDLGWNSDRGRYLTRAQAQTCLDLYRTTLGQFNEVLSAPLPMPPSLEERGFLERPWMPDIEHIEPDQLRKFYNRVGRLLVKRGAL